MIISLLIIKLLDNCVCMDSEVSGQTDEKTNMLVYMIKQQDEVCHSCNQSGSDT
uniref:Uncharacterized protein n=1 Tax=Arion vulgaris TaxID=1028688 RepID=A0A0B6Y2C0_9EUPU